MDQETDFSICSSGGELISSLWAEETTTQTKGIMDRMVEWWNKPREVRVIFHSMWASVIHPTHM